jgi:hypothetical protein
MKTIANVLKGGRKRILEGWCQGESALNAKDNVTCVNSRDAVAWCLEGGIEAAAPTTDAWLTAELALCDALGADDISMLSIWNDKPGRTQAEVVALFDKAIAKLEGI